MEKTSNSDVLDFILMNCLHVDSENVVDYKCNTFNKNFKGEATNIVLSHFEYFGEEYKLQEKDFIMLKGKIYSSFDANNKHFGEITLNEEQEQQLKDILKKYNLNDNEDVENNEL